MVRIFMYSIFPHRTEYGETLRIFPYSGRIRENWIQQNTDQKKLRIWTLFTQWLISGSILRFPARINFRTAIIKSISLWFILICCESWHMSYADDNFPYACSKNFDFIRETIEEVGKTFFKWFSNIFLKANAGKCHVILSTVPAVIYLLKVNNRNTRARC